MRRALLSLVLAAGLLPACGSKNDTRIVVAVWSDLTVPIELDAVRIDVAGPTDSRFQIFPLTATDEPGKNRLPVLLELVPLGARDASFLVEAQGLLGPSAKVAQSARVAFVPGQSLLLELFLERSCQTARCPASYTCAHGSCDRLVAVPTLPPYDPNHPLSPPDGGAGLDGGSVVDGGDALDATTRDVLVDRFTVDAAGPELELDGAVDAPSFSDGGNGDGRRDDPPDLPVSDVPAAPEVLPDGNAQADVPDPREQMMQLCFDTGGQLDTQVCCANAGDFRDTCMPAVGACACAPTSSKALMICTCPNGGCFSAQTGCSRIVDAGATAVDGPIDSAWWLEAAAVKCESTGGAIEMQTCCEGTKDLRDTCAETAGTCSCPASSTTVLTCACPSGACFSPSSGCNASAGR